jgi:hypothetical protein
MLLSVLGVVCCIYVGVMCCAYGNVRVMPDEPISTCFPFQSLCFLIAQAKRFSLPKCFFTIKIFLDYTENRPLTSRLFSLARIRISEASLRILGPGSIEKSKQSKGTRMNYNDSGRSSVPHFQPF